MKKKLAVAVIALSLIPATAQARGYHVAHLSTLHTSRLSSVGQYHLTYHRTQRIKCSYSGCRSDYKP